VDSLHVLVAAAGRGSRAGLPYPKTLYPVEGVPILLRIMALVAPYDSVPTLIVSQQGKDQIYCAIESNSVNANLVVQPEPLGMGDAVLCFADSPAFSKAEHVLLIWGDIPFIQPETLAQMVTKHFSHSNDFTFVTRFVESAYTLVSRDSLGAVKAVDETRELGIHKPQAGERDIGLFIFRKAPIFQLLTDDLPGKFGKTTGEHGFLYLIEHLVKLGFRVEGLPIATEKDLISLNRLSDLTVL
jgi:bifunctional UDP-N-acetylglucosamine pyrophosphorylase/glucosamine-1-phosphate N-acetyltransferase